MAPDQLHHKRKNRRNRFERSFESRETYKVVLIVCEGTKTEPNYFDGLRQFYHLNKANIKIDKYSGGSDPLSLVNKAEEAFEKERRDGGYDSVFIVFDRDGHQTYKTGIQKIKQLNQREGNQRFHAIFSVPCFEFWILLHYEYTSRPYACCGGKSACDRVIEELKKHIPGYEKGNPKTFSELYLKTNLAIKNAEILDKEQERSNTEDPLTKVYFLAKYLREIFPTRNPRQR